MEPGASESSSRHRVVVGDEERVTPSASRRRLIFLVDDDEAIRDALVDLFTLEGYPVEGFSNGREVLERLYAPPRPNVIVLDLLMPEMNGFQFRAAQRQSPFASIPIIVLTAHYDGELWAQAEGLAFCRKPIDIDTLLALVQGFAG